MLGDVIGAVGPVGTGDDGCGVIGAGELPDGRGVFIPNGSDNPTLDCAVMVGVGGLYVFGLNGDAGGV